MLVNHKGKLSANEQQTVESVRRRRRRDVLLSDDDVDNKNVIREANANEKIGMRNNNQDEAASNDDINDFGYNNDVHEGERDTGYRDRHAEAIAKIMAKSARRADIIAKINATSGESIYHKAAMQGNLNFLRETVNAGDAWVLKIGDVNGWTPLHEAVRAGHVDVVDYLVQMVEMDIEQETYDGSKPLSLALRYHGMRHPVTKMLQTFVQCGGTDLFS